MPKCLSKINTFKYRACLCVAHKKYHRSASSFAFGTQQACVPRNEIFHITSVLPFQTQALLPFFYFISSGPQTIYSPVRTDPEVLPARQDLYPWADPYWQRISLLRLSISLVILLTSSYDKCLIGSLPLFIQRPFRDYGCFAY